MNEGQLTMSEAVARGLVRIVPEYQLAEPGYRSYERGVLAHILSGLLMATVDKPAESRGILMVARAVGCRLEVLR